MLAKTYQAFKAAGVPEEDAIAAAEELAAYENRLSQYRKSAGRRRRPARISGGSRLTDVENRLDHIESRLAVVETKVAELAPGKINVLTWAVGINAAATIAILGVLLRGH